jgi:hypothetical protein
MADQMQAIHAENVDLRNQLLAMNAAPGAIPTAVTFTASADLKRLTDLRPRSIEAFADQFHPNMTIRSIELMTDTVIELLTNHFLSMYPEAASDWHNWSTVKLCDWLKQKFPKQAQTAALPLLERVKFVDFAMDLQDTTVLDQSLTKLIDIEQTTSLDELADDEAQAVAYLVTRKLKDHSNAALAQFAQKNGVLDRTQLPKTFEELRIKLLACQRSTRELIAEVSQIANVTLKGTQAGKSSRNDNNSQKYKGMQQEYKRHKPNPSSKRPEPCKICGNSRPDKRK